MYIIQTNTDGKVVDIMRARSDVTANSIVVVDDIPSYRSKSGYRGELMYTSEGGLYWEDIKVPSAATEADYKEALAEMGVDVNDEG